jgi:hypothetical protein
MSPKEVDVADLVKQHAELGEMIVKLGGTIVKAEGDGDEIEKGKGKKKPFPPKDEYDDMDEDEVAKKAAAEAVAKAAADKKAAAEIAKKAEAEKAEKERLAKEAAENDEELVVKGQTIKKSVICDIQFGLMKSMTEEIEKNSADIKKAKDEATLAKLEKRADDEFSHVPGTTAERAAILKAVSEMPDALKKSFETVLKQSEALAKSAFTMKGTNAGDSEDVRKGRQDFEAKVAEIKKAEGCTRAEAMSKARVSHPDLFKIYQQDSN